MLPLRALGADGLKCEGIMVINPSYPSYPSYSQGMLWSVGSGDDRLLGNALGCRLAEGKSELRASGLLRESASGSAGGDLLQPA